LISERTLSVFAMGSENFPVLSTIPRDGQRSEQQIERAFIMMDSRSKKIIERGQLKL
jgi:hypothetical protein